MGHGPLELWAAEDFAVLPMWPWRLLAASCPMDYVWRPRGFQEARGLLQESLQILRRIFGPEHRDTAQVESMLATVNSRLATSQSPSPGGELVL